MKFIVLLSLLIQSLAFSVEPLTITQLRAQKEFEIRAKTEGWTFTYDVRNIGKWAKGFNPKSSQGPIYSLGVDQKLKSFGIDAFGKKLIPILDQGQCGSCVIFSIMGNWMNTMILHGMNPPLLSMQQLMNCGTGGQCNGADGEGVAGDLVNLKQLHTDADYPYTARSGSCKNVAGQVYGKIDSYLTIDGSVRSMLAALHNGQPVSVGIGADNAFSSYTSGIFNACSPSSIDHYVVIEEINCETSVDADGNCAFDSKGNLPPGMGWVKVRNSWSLSYGDQGYIKMKITDSKGRRCLNIANGQGNSQILDVGMPLPEDKPVTFVVESGVVKLTATVNPGAGYSVDQAKAALQNALSAMGDK